MLHNKWVAFNVHIVLAITPTGRDARCDDESYGATIFLAVHRHIQPSYTSLDPAIKNALAKHG